MLTRIVATRVAEWWLECRTERIGFYERHGFALVAPEDLRRRITYFLFAEARKKGRKKEGASTRNSPTKTRPFFAFRKG